MNTERKKRKIKPYTTKWEKMADTLARSTVDIIPCKHCGYPVIMGRCCDTCGSDEPR